MALGKTRSEIRKIPEWEYREWKLYFQIEPFGFPDNEYRTAVLLTKIHNSNVAKKKDAKSIDDFYRDLGKELINNIRAEIKKEEYENLSDDEKREIAIIKAKRIFGVA